MNINKREFSSVAVLLLVLLVLILCVVVGIIVANNKPEEVSNTSQISSFEECVAAGNSVMESDPEQCSAYGKVYINQRVANEQRGQTVESGQGAFSVTFPDGWRNIIKVTDSDWFLIVGQDQPQAKAGLPINVSEVENYGSDNPSVFSISINDNFAEPNGVAEDFTLVNGKENPILGKKYTYIYEKDSLEGIGFYRFKGDRDYEYLFPLSNGKELRVRYSVYGSDPRNNLETIEALIDTIRVTK